METLEEEPISLSSLPIEVLIRIFAYLSLPDRRSVRLACHQFYDLCAVFSIKKREKFVLKTEANVTEFATFLLTKSQYQNLSVEFQEISNFNRMPDELWRVSGEKFYSLDFLNSSLSDSMMENVITCCVNLVELQIGVSHSFFAEFDFPKVLFSQKAFDNPIRRKVRRPKLRVFSLVVEHAHIPSWLLRSIFLVYPCIVKFGIGSSSYSSHMRTSSFPRPSRYLKHFDQLESLIFNVMSTGSWIKAWINQPKLQPKLMRFEAILLYSESLVELLAQFFNIQTKLRAVILTFIDYPIMNDESTNDLFKLIAHVCEKCVDLGEFILISK